MSNNNTFGAVRLLISAFVTGLRVDSRDSSQLAKAQIEAQDYLEFIKQARNDIQADPAKIAVHGVPLSGVEQSHLRRLFDLVHRSPAMVAELPPEAAAPATWPAPATAPVAVLSQESRVTGSLPAASEGSSAAGITEKEVASDSLDPTNPNTPQPSAPPVVPPEPAPLPYTRSSFPDVDAAETAAAAERKPFTASSFPQDEPEKEATDPNAVPPSLVTQPVETVPQTPPSGPAPTSVTNADGSITAGGMGTSLPLAPSADDTIGLTEAQRIGTAPSPVPPPLETAPIPPAPGYVAPSDIPPAEEPLPAAEAAAPAATPAPTPAPVHPASEDKA